MFEFGKMEEELKAFFAKFPLAVVVVYAAIKYVYPAVLKWFGDKEVKELPKK